LAGIIRPRNFAFCLLTGVTDDFEAWPHTPDPCEVLKVFSLCPVTNEYCVLRDDAGVISAWVDEARRTMILRLSWLISCGMAVVPPNGGLRMLLTFLPGRARPHGRALLFPA
jgi:hypothetical protein